MVMRKRKRLKDLTFHTFLVINFSSDSMARVAVKWLGQDAWADQNFGLRDSCLKRVLKTQICVHSDLGVPKGTALCLLVHIKVGTLVLSTLWVEHVLRRLELVCFFFF